MSTTAIKSEGRSMQIRIDDVTESQRMVYEDSEDLQVFQPSQLLVANNGDIQEEEQVDFRVEIEKKFERSECNVHFRFPEIEKHADNNSSDSSINSLDNVLVYNLHAQNMKNYQREYLQMQDEVEEQMEKFKVNELLRLQKEEEEIIQKERSQHQIKQKQIIQQQVLASFQQDKTRNLSATIKDRSSGSQHNQHPETSSATSRIKQIASNSIQNQHQIDDWQQQQPQQKQQLQQQQYQKSQGQFTITKDSLKSRGHSQGVGNIENPAIATAVSSRLQTQSSQRKPVKSTYISNAQVLQQVWNETTQQQPKKSVSMGIGGQSGNMKLVPTKQIGGSNNYIQNGHRQEEKKSAAFRNLIEANQMKLQQMNKHTKNISGVPVVAVSGTAPLISSVNYSKRMKTEGNEVDSDTMNGNSYHRHLYLKTQQAGGSQRINKKNLVLTGEEFQVGATNNVDDDDETIENFEEALKDGSDDGESGEIARLDAEEYQKYYEGYSNGVKSISPKPKITLKNPNLSVGSKNLMNLSIQGTIQQQASSSTSKNYKNLLEILEKNSKQNIRKFNQPLNTSKKGGVQHNGGNYPQNAQIAIQQQAVVVAALHVQQLQSRTPIPKKTSSVFRASAEKSAQFSLNQSESPQKITASYSRTALMPNCQITHDNDSSKNRPQSKMLQYEITPGQINSSSGKKAKLHQKLNQIAGDTAIGSINQNVEQRLSTQGQNQQRKRSSSNKNNANQKLTEPPSQSPFHSIQFRINPSNTQATVQSQRMVDSFGSKINNSSGKISTRDNYVRVPSGQLQTTIVNHSIGQGISKIKQSIGMSTATAETISSSQNKVKPRNASSLHQSQQSGSANTGSSVNCQTTNTNSSFQGNSIIEKNIECPSHHNNKSSTLSNMSIGSNGKRQMMSSSSSSHLLPQQIQAENRNNRSIQKQSLSSSSKLKMQTSGNSQRERQFSHHRNGSNITAATRVQTEFFAGDDDDDYLILGDSPEIATRPSASTNGLQIKYSNQDQPRIASTKMMTSKWKNNSASKSITLDNPVSQLYQVKAEEEDELSNPKRSAGHRIRNNLVQTSVDFTSDSHSIASNPNAQIEKIREFLLQKQATGVIQSSISSTQQRPMCPPSLQTKVLYNPPAPLTTAAHQQIQFQYPAPQNGTTLTLSQKSQQYYPHSHQCQETDAVITPYSHLPYTFHENNYTGTTQQPQHLQPYPAFHFQKQLR